jgi:hypothetical protein
MNRLTISAVALAAGLMLQTHAFAQIERITGANAAATPADPESAARESWRSLMAHNTVPADGCFRASYPNIVWESVECKIAAPRFHPVHIKPQDDTAQVVGNGHDYIAQSQGLIGSALGYFKATGVTSETSVGVAAYGNAGLLGANEYTLQLNTNFNKTTSVCAGHSGCNVWQQFIYASDYSGNRDGAVYIQYWMIGYGSSCPSGWDSSGSDCYKNSATVAVADIPITDLGSISLSANVTAGGNDVVTFSSGSEAYVLTAKDSVLDIASVWDQAEFNVVGNGGGSEAQFNAGSSITVYLFVGDGTFTAPTCSSGHGTTAETNNLNLGSCQASVFLEPFIQFTEFLLKPVLPPIVPIVPIIGGR